MGSIMLIFIFSLCFFSYSCSPLTTSVCSSATFENGKKYQMVETTTRLKMVTEEEDGCQVLLNVLLVGSGGDEDIFEGHGGGSGFVDFKQVLVESSDLLSVTIGRAGNFGTSGDPTTLEIYGGDLILGVPGDGGGNGGNGYSGGGGGGANGFPAGDGGFDGGDGEHSPFSSEGGRGSGLNITSFDLQYFKLRAGAGGIGSGFYGGGGGGVVVVGDERQHQKAEEGNGEGYGGGGGSSGSKGVALLEIVDSL